MIKSTKSHIEPSPRVIIFLNFNMLAAGSGSCWSLPGLICHPSGANLQGAHQQAPSGSREGRLAL